MQVRKNRLSGFIRLLTLGKIGAETWAAFTCIIADTLETASDLCDWSLHRIGSKSRKILAVMLWIIDPV